VIAEPLIIFAVNSPEGPLINSPAPSEFEPSREEPVNITAPSCIYQTAAKTPVTGVANKEAEGITNNPYAPPALARVVLGFLSVFQPASP
jgi:hypothetical protein